MSRALWAFILCAARLLSVNAAAADEPAVPVEAMIPVVAVHLDRPVTAEEMDDVVSGLAAPVLRGNALRSRLGLPPSPDNSRVDEVIRAFEKGEDLFFTGNHEEAARAFETVVARLADNPSMLAFKPALRKVAFKAHIHLAIISRGNGMGRRRRRTFGPQRSSRSSLCHPPIFRRGFASVLRRSKRAHLRQGRAPSPWRYRARAS